MAARTLGCIDRFGRTRGETMIDWDSDTWGGTVHLASNGSWVDDTHRRDADGQD